MSAVLGPIHEWMYNKVIIQEKIIGAHAMRICESSDSRVEVMRTMDTHSAYWENVGLTGDIY